MTNTTLYTSPLGPLFLVSDGVHLVKICMNQESNVPVSHDNDPIFKEITQWLDEYFGGINPCVSRLKLLPNGTAFQQRVWHHLLEIPYGQSTSYGAIATKIANELGIKKMSAQAIGQAVGANQIPIIIPCHRVLGTNGKLTGYAGGITRKMYLLEHENIAYKK